MNKKIKISVLGCGHIGKKHAEMISQNLDCELVALIDILDKSTLNISEYVVPFFNSLDQFLESNLATDFIAICTPNGLHFTQAQKILNNNISVIVEKPMTLCAEEAIALKELAEEKNLFLFPVMQNRFSPPAAWLKNMMESRILGKIYMVQISCYWNRDERYYQKNSWRGTKNLDGGTLFTQFSHYLDIMNWLFGDITNINSKLKDFSHQDFTEFEDSGIITFDFTNGGIGSFSFSTSVWQENLESSLTVIAENGSVKVGGQYMDRVEKCLIKNYTMPQLSETNASNDYGTFKGSAQNHHFLYANIVEVLKNESSAQNTPEESIKVIEIIERIYNNKNHQ